VVGAAGSHAFDAICGMWLKTNQVAATYTYLGQSYAFCYEECRDVFARTPDVYVVFLAHEPTSSAGYRCRFIVRQMVAWDSRLSGALA
jgi:YHS domain-containing protein